MRFYLQRKPAIAWLLALFALCAGCGEKTSQNTESKNADITAAEAEILDAQESALQAQAAVIAAALDNRQLAAQVMLTGIDGRGSLGTNMRLLLEECPAGGIILFRYNLDTPAGAIQNLIAECAAVILEGTLPLGANKDGILPFVAVDHEGGSVNRFLPGAVPLPAAFSYWQQAEAEGREAALARITADAFRSGIQIKSMGINLNLAPVAEYLTSSNSVFLDDRSYGPDSEFTAAASAAFIQGMEQAGLLCVVKHFPGSAGPDPHRYPSVLEGDLQTLAALTAPFAELAGKKTGAARALMVAHTAVPAYDTEYIASLSPAIMGGWLRGKLGFSGIIIADDFSMGAAVNSNSSNGFRLSSEAAAVQSLAAGADMALVWPRDIRRTHQAIQMALANGTLPRARLQDAAGRILYEKLKMGLIHGE